VIASDEPLDSQRPLLVGRAGELARFAQVLDAGTPALVLLPAGVGMGKSSFLREIQLRAAESGWRTVPRPLAVRADTTEGSLEAELRTALDLSGDQLDMARRSGRTSGPIDVTEQRRAAPDQLIELLARRAPFLLSIKGYRPAPEFAGRFSAFVGEGLRGTSSPVIIAVADLPSALEPLRPHATTIIPLGELEPEPVRQHLERLGRELEPRFTDGELESYVLAVGKNPGLLGSLTRVLQLERVRPTAAGAVT
jgi:hypothetical protein